MEKIDYIMGYYTIKELIGLNGLPKTSQGILKKAKKESWQKISINKKSCAYAISSLPSDAQRDLIIKKYNEEKVESEKKKNELEKLYCESLNYFEQKYYDSYNQEKFLASGFEMFFIRSKMEIILNFELYKQTDCGHYPQSFVKKYNNNQIKIFKWVKILIPKISWRDLAEWYGFISKCDLLSLGK